jgi:putative aldouronate transport system permease protein
MGRTYRQTTGSKVFDFCNVVFLIVLSATFIYPFLYVLSVSFSDPTAVGLGQVHLFPVGFDTKGYRLIFAYDALWRAYLNTIYYSAVATIVTIIFTALTAYPLSIKRFSGRKYFVIFFVITMFVNGGLIPRFLTVQALGLMNTVWALVLPVSLTIWNIVLMRVNFEHVPDSLRESALMDGASNFRILFQIVLPLSKAIIATIALWTIVAQWNSFFAPLLYLNEQEKFPLQIVLRKLIISNTPRGEGLTIEFFGGTERGDIKGFLETLKMAAVVVSIGPIILVYPFLQRYFIKGVLVGSIKG